MTKAGFYILRLFRLFPESGQQLAPCILSPNADNLQTSQLPGHLEFEDLLATSSHNNNHGMRLQQQLRHLQPFYLPVLSGKRLSAFGTLKKKCTY
uniref:HDC09245 n=1 Tax=Drosophila melanogaster TaxID=7227 RepID=Q6ILJ8_DROME|nr:TPA_inf: HDC09245 [Drosophila melanogaster]